MATDPTQLLKNLGLSDKAAKVYLACLELGEATVQDLARRAKLKRTTIYYTLEELKDIGAVFQTKRNKKIYFLPEEPMNLLKRVRERIWEVERSIDVLEDKKHAVFHKPRIYFLYGPSGFKHIWDMIFQSKQKEFRILTEGVNFLDFVKERYILEEIIKTKKKLGISSRQLIVDSEYAREIVEKDSQENRQSKILPAKYQLPFTEVITKEFVAFISPRWDNTLFVVENERFAETRKAAFEMLWEKI